MSDSSPVVFEISQVAFSFHADFRLKVDTFRLAAGERVACIGPSGTGKTTLIRLLTGELLPERGDILFCGRSVCSMSDAERRFMRISNIGLVFQEFELIDYLTALENILLPYHVSRHLRVTREVTDRARSLATTAGIEHVLRRTPRRLSQGERQRVAICRALVTQPRVVLCDEPTGNLDPQTASRVLDLLFTRSREIGAALFMVTHNYGILDQFDRVVDVTELNAVPQSVGVSS